MHHLYLSYQPSAAALDAERGALVRWCEEAGVQEYRILEEKLTSGRISQFQLTKLLKPVLPGDTVVAASLRRLGRSINMLLSVLKILHGRGVTIITVNDGRIFLPDEDTSAYIAALESFVALATGIKAERGNEALDRAKADGKQFGRPAGQKKAPEKNVLYGKTEQLEALRAQGLSPQKIAVRLGVSRGTVANYLKAQGLP